MSVNQKPRPLSPHLQVYRPQLTSMLSILHRGTGVFLSLGSIALVLWLIALAEGPDAYAAFQTTANHWFAQLLIVAWTFSLFYHLCNGIRHLFWDAGAGLELSQLYRSGVVVVLASTALTLLALVVAYRQGGGVL